MSAFTIPLHKQISDYLSDYARQQPDREAVVFGEQRLSYAELETRVQQCAKALLSKGIEKGDRIAVLCTSRPEYWITFLAATRIGAVWMGLNPKYRLQEMQYVIGDAQPKLLFAIASFENDAYKNTIKTLRQDFAFIETLVALTEPLPNSLSFEAFLASGSSVSDHDVAQRQATINTLDPALLVYTSGSTGKPKGAMLSHYGLCFGSLAQDQQLAVKNPRITCSFPINHVACVADTCCLNLVGGGTLIFSERYDTGWQLQMIAEEQLNIVGGVPTMLLMLLDHPDFSKTDFSQVELIVWGGAAMPVSLIERLQACAPRLMNVYGLTETAANTTFTSPDADVIELSETIGRPSPHMPCRIVNSNGQTCEVGEHGELQFKGDYLLLEYLNRPDATRDVYTEDGWLHTGDLGYWRDNGTISLVGRLSEMFKSGGYNVYPREIEDVLESHPAVQMAAVVGVPDPRYQEVGAAYIAVNQPLDTDELTHYCRQHLANYKIPKTITILEQLPTLPVGKVDKVALKNRRI